MKRRRPVVWLIVFYAVGGHPALVRAAPCDAGSPTVFEVGGQDSLSELRGAVNCTSGGQIDATWTGPVVVPETMVIGNNTFLNIIGTDDAEAIANPNTRLFQVDSGGGLQITSMSLSGGSAVEGGGAIWSESGSVSVENCDFYNNSATSGEGGAIWATAGSVNITGGYFRNNTAVGHKGGAVYAIDVELNARGGARFEHNWAEEGGAVFCGGSQSASSDVTLCSFSDVVFFANNASSTTDVDVDGFGYLGWAPPWEGLSGGGGLSVVNTIASLRGCSFEANYAQLSGAGVHANVDTTTFVDGCTFSKNYSPGFGGGSTVFSASFTGETSFEYNGAGRNGAAVSLTCESSTTSAGCLMGRPGSQSGIDRSCLKESIWIDVQHSHNFLEMTSCTTRGGHPFNEAVQGLLPR